MINNIKFKYVGTNEKPTYKKHGDSGFDLPIEQPIWTPENPYVLAPNDRIVVHTGVWLAECGKNLEIQIRSRSGLSIQQGLVVVNSPGTIDSGYRGELLVGLHNVSNNFIKLIHGMRVAQAVICPVLHLDEVLYTEEIQEDTDRGIGGFGHTGLL